MPTISLIAALANNHVIGLAGALPWQQKTDLQYFKDKTVNKPIIMGRKTFDTLGRPLPKRRNIVITRQQDLTIPGVEVFNDLTQAIAACADASEVMIVGGAKIYELALPIADQMYLTFIDAEPKGDTFFPQWDQAQWQVVSEEAHSADQDNQYAYKFLMLTRSNKNL